MVGPRSIATCLLILSVLFCVDGQLQKHKLCVNIDQANSNINCRNLNRADSLVSCAFVNDSVDCSLKILKGDADFGVYTGEEAVLSSKFLLERGLVTHEVRQRDYFAEPYAFQSVAVVKSSFVGGLEGLRKKNFCHTGFSETQYWNDYVLKFFERTVIKGNDQKCDRAKPAIVNELDSLRQFFNSSCRPGVWANNEYYDKQLKSEYPELCNLCDNRGIGCSYMSPRNQGDHVAALNCVTRGAGDVAYVSLQSVRDYFKLSIGGVVQGNFRFLCQDGTTQPIVTSDNGSPCAWVKQPWSTVVASKNSADDLKMNLERWVSNPIKNSWQETLRTIILQNSLVILNITENNSMPITVTDYVKRGREIPEENSASTCADPIRWCVLRNETDKCRWLKAASLTHGIAPELKCIEGNDQWDCFKKIQDNMADFIGIDSSVGYIARYVYALSSQMFQDTTSEDFYQAIAVINNRRPATSPIRNLSDLRNKKACFAEFGDIAWVSFVEALRKQNIVRNACPYGKTVGTFFSQVCAPGAGDASHNQPRAVENVNTCSLCGRGFCNATITNKYFGDSGAFECLSKGGGDVAFLNRNRLRQIIESKQVNVGDYSVLCTNGTTQKLNDTIDEDCPLITVVGGDLIGRISRTKTQSIDFYLSLLNMVDWFGQSKHNNEHVFHMFGTFDGKDDLIFKSNTNDLINFFDQQLDVVKNYVELKSRAGLCGAASSASTLFGSVTFVVAAILATLAARK